jgi:hypothetical protein
MIDKIKNKEMQPEDRGELYCIKECEIPGVGYFRVGDAVKPHEQYAMLKDHPFFSNHAPEVK